jgi:hypothetical protein
MAEAGHLAFQQGDASLSDLFECRAGNRQIIWPTKEGRRGFPQKADSSHSPILPSADNLNWSPRLIPGPGRGGYGVEPELCKTWNLAIEVDVYTHKGIF